MIERHLELLRTLIENDDFEPIFFGKLNYPNSVNIEYTEGDALDWLTISQVNAIWLRESRISSNGEQHRDYKAPIVKLEDSVIKYHPSVVSSYLKNEFE